MNDYEQDRQCTLSSRDSGFLRAVTVKIIVFGGVTSYSPTDHYHLP
jgi:hypothetical protein